ncbi:nucleic-acid-binding protein from transposon X-element [Trichonephila clavipes]|nr:nucleic-acid-binding protein from transposon X-element [Trichonephila clavipes]
MATDSNSTMECQNIPLPTSRPSSPELSTPCEQLIQIHSNIRKFSLLAKGTEDSLRLLSPYMKANDPEVVDLFARLKYYQEQHHDAECEYGTLYCTTPGCTVHGTPPPTPNISQQEFPALPKINSQKRKENDDGFVSPTRRQTIKKPNLILSPNFTLETDNKFSNLKQQEIAGTSNDNTTTNDPPPPTNTPKTYLPPPIMLKTSEKTREHMKVITTAFPNIRSKLSGELIKLYTNTSIDYHKLLNLLDQHQFQYHVITPKDERPIKVVIKGLPCNTDINDIKSDLTDQGFTDTKVSQLIGRITKQKLPVFMITLPRNINNAKIFQIKTLSYLSIRVEGYEGTGVTQCYKCNRFNHTSDNCHMIPRCLKCGEAHQTKDCPIQRVETAYCINCQTYGHMANYSKCPLFPKPRKGKTTKNNYTTVVDSIVRPNITYAQATNNKKSDQYKNTQQMAPRVNDAPAISSQNQTNRPFNKPPATQELNLIENSPQFAIVQTLQQTMHTLAILTQQIASLNFNALAPQKI